MAACSKCGSVIPDGASFCSVCGSPVSVISKPVAPPPPPPPYQAPAGVTTAGMTSNVAGALAYLLGPITGIIFLVLEPYKRDPFVRFHAFQSIFLSVAMILVNIAISILASIGFLWALFSMISMLVSLGFFLLWLFMMYKAYNKEMFKVPVIGDIAVTQAAK